MAEQPDTGTVAASALVARYGTLVERAKDQVRGSAERPGSTQLLDALSRAHAAVLTDDRVADLPLGTQATISASADVLGDLANVHGRSALALAIFTTALRIDERKQALEPGNTTYRRDLSISFNKLADLALAAGRSGDAEALYRQSLAVARELAELEPGNTTYRRDLSISYERLASVAAELGQAEEARAFVTLALDVRGELHALEPRRADLAEELGYALYLKASIVRDQAEAARQEIRSVLEPFEQAGTITRRGISLLTWARQSPSS